MYPPFKCTEGVKTKLWRFNTDGWFLKRQCDPWLGSKFENSKFDSQQILNGMSHEVPSGRK